MSPLERDQADFATRMNASAYFADIGVYVFRPRENLTATLITQRIQQALACLAKKAGKGGAAVSVLMPTADTPEGNVRGPELEERIIVRVQEDPLVNMGATGTLKSAESIALEVLQLFHHFRSGGQIWYADTNSLTPNLEFPGKVTYDVAFRRKLPLAVPEKSTMPMLSPESGTAPQTITITAVAGAAIWYSLDGSYPAPDAEASVLYTEPIELAAPAILRAVAYEPYKQASNVVEQTYGSAEDFGNDFGDDFAIGP